MDRISDDEFETPVGAPGDCPLCGSTPCSCSAPQPSTTPPGGAPPRRRPPGGRSAPPGGVTRSCRRQLFRDDQPSTSTGRTSCVTCGKSFHSIAKLQQHSQAHNAEKPFTCNICEKAFSSKFKLVRHGLIHSDKRQYVCSVCQRTFHRKDHLKNHAKVHSPVKRRYKCERTGCNKEYSSPLSLRKHEAAHDAEDGILQCKICGELFPSKDQILFHLKVHAGSRTVKTPADKKYRCDLCGRRFFTGKDVRRHSVVHTGRRDFLCQYCPQRFGRKDHLVRHVKKSHSAPSHRGRRGKRTTRAVATIIEEQRASEDFPCLEDLPEVLELLRGDGGAPPSNAPLPTFNQAFPPPSS